MRIIHAGCVALLFSLLAAPAAASVVVTYDAANPVTLAGSLPASAQDLRSLPLDFIIGNLGPDLNAVNLFAITVQQPSNFSAFTLDVGAHGAADTELFLFDSVGRAVYGNDDISGGNTLSCLPSDGLANPCPVARGGLGPVSAGTYYLGVTRSAQLPLDLFGNALFAATADSTALVGRAAPLPLAFWDGGAFTDPNFDNSYYAIAVTGTVPEPGTLLLGGAALALLVVRKRWAAKR